MALSTLASILLSIAAFQTVYGHKIVTYWGQNAVYGMLKPRQYWEKDLAVFCRDYKYDTIILSFLNVFFDNANKDNMPGFNFAFHCETPVSPEYPKLFRCPKIEEGIKECQKNGKTVLMSLGGAVGRAGFANDGEAKTFAYRVYHLLLEGTDLQSIRPFGSAVLDGIDLDIEGGTYTGYTAFVKELRRLMSTGTKKYTIGAAPQCPFPDGLQGPSPGRFLGDVPTLVDEIYVQFYNNWCHTGNPRVFWDHVRMWMEYSEKTNGPFVFVGVPGNKKASGNPQHYRTPAELAKIYERIKTMPRFGGIMFWDASFDQNNMIDGKHFSEHIADFLVKGPLPTGKPVTLPPGKSTQAPKTEKPQTAKPTPEPTPPSKVSCKGLADGLYPDPDDVHKFFQCAGGVVFRHSCPAGTVFNPKIKACDWPSSA